MRRSPLAAAALCLLAAAPALAQRLEAVASQGESALAKAVEDGQDLNFAAFKRAAAQPQRQPGAVVPADALGAPLHEIELAPLLNNIRRTAATFRAGESVVHVFGDKSQNKNEWFIGLSVDADTRFKKGWKILHYWLKPGAETWRVDIGGRSYGIRIDGQLRHRMQSKVVIEPADKAEAKTVFTVEQLSNAAFEAGLPVRIGGTQYRLLYSQNFNEDGNGDFGGYTVDRSIVLMSRNEKGELKGYHWFEREIPEGRVLVTTPRAADSNDGYEADSVTLGLSRSNGKLRIYYPVAPR